ncbi:hypothetical protein [Pseudomonas sp. F16(2018)]|uniref:hypothetical protein n=1 Tax=Pseudomonas sp. F16(2018) TaxID=2093746 RepID=UPI001117B799|nr:hypothetical protein [Pseudomonas sp. F16(2018)]
MRIDIYQAGDDRILLVLDGKGIPHISGKGSEFLEGLKHERQVDLINLPAGLPRDEVKKSIDERGYYAARYSATITEVDIQEK